MVKSKSLWSQVVKTTRPTNMSISARNFQPQDLGAVIFGCTNNTIAECHSRQLFGLPRAHISYVRNIREGLPLFLFNYDDHRLYGIYEAAGSGCDAGKGVVFSTSRESVQKCYYSQLLSEHAQCPWLEASFFSV